jgi:monovalent cation:proton antiporter-2 (CPA2) family protein
MDPALFLNAFIYLAAATIAAPLGRRLGIGAVLGYLVVGAIIGPEVLGLTAKHGKEVLHFAEFGVVLMLFVIGLELDLGRLWRMRTSIFGLGGLQLTFSAAALALVAGLIASDWREALALGLILALSSTAIVMQTLKERGLTGTSSGKQGFAVLLFQDIAVIPVLAFLPTLAHLPIPASSGGDHSKSAVTEWINNLPAWGEGLAIIGAIAIVIVLGRFILTPWLRWVAHLKVPEALNATTLTLVVGTALLMNSVGLSPALGTFVAGVMLASSAYRHELEANIEPFKSLLLAVFFLAVGASINFTLIASQPLTIAAFVVALIAIKALVLFVLSRIFRLSLDQGLLFSIALAQGGEFAFVLGGFALGHGILSPAITAQMIAAVALSMALSPILLIALQKFILPKLGTTESAVAPKSDIENHHSKVILAGFGRFGHPIIRLLRSAGHMPTVLEQDSDHVDFIRRIGLKCYYGDATRLELLHAAGAAEARILIIAVDDEDSCMEIVSNTQKHFPHLKILARACSRDHVYLLHEAGVKYFIEQLGSSLDCAIEALSLIGHDLEHAKDAARRFKEKEIESIEKLAEYRGNQSQYIDAANQNLRDLDSLLENAPLKTGKH